MNEMVHNGFFILLFFFFHPLCDLFNFISGARQFSTRIPSLTHSFISNCKKWKLIGHVTFLLRKQDAIRRKRRSRNMKFSIKKEVTQQRRYIQKKQNIFCKLNAKMVNGVPSNGCWWCYSLLLCPTLAGNHFLIFGLATPNTQLGDAATQWFLFAIKISMKSIFFNKLARGTTG